MAKYIKSHSNYILKKKHQNIDNGTVYYQDQLTVNGISEFSNVDGQIPIYRDGNFLLTTRMTNGYTRSQAPRQFQSNAYSGDVWTNEVLDNYPQDKDSQSDTMQIKFSYYSLKDFSYYGSCSELVKSSINDIISTYPAELYVDGSQTEGFISEPVIKRTVLGESGYTYTVSNPFNIDIVTKRAYSENVKQPLRYFSNSGYSNYELIDLSGNTHAVTEWYSNNRYLKDGTLFNGSDGEWTTIVLNKQNKTCFYNGDETAEVRLRTEDGITINFRVYKLNDSSVINTTADFIGWHIRPNQTIVNDWFLNLDRFESILMSRDSNPIYTCKFQMIMRDITTGKLYSKLNTFTFPVDGSNWNLDVANNNYLGYLTKFTKLASNYDELFCDNLYKNMTHESIKNMDWSVRKFFNAEHDNSEDYDASQNNFNRIIRLMGREFDEIKFYIDGLNSLNVLNYKDEDTNMPDYYLSDSDELEGWEVKSPYTKTLSEYIDYSGVTIYRDVNPSGNNEFLDSFAGIEFDVNEKENYAQLKCQNKEIVNIDGTQYEVDNHTITINGKVYKETTISGMPCYDIVTDIPYFVRYIELNGVKYYVDETTKTVTMLVDGEKKTYSVADGQTEVEVSKEQWETHRIYRILYDQVYYTSDLGPNDTFMSFSIPRTGATHNNVPITEGNEKEDFVITATTATTKATITTTGWSNDNHVGSYREYFTDPTDSSKQIFLNYVDANPIGDPAVEVTCADNTKRTVTRLDTDGDKVVISNNSLNENAVYTVMPFLMHPADYQQRYGSLVGYPYNTVMQDDEKTLVLPQASKVSSVDLGAKNIVIYQTKSDDFTNKEFVMLFNDYVCHTTNGSSVASQDGLSILGWGEINVEDIPNKTDASYIYTGTNRSWSDFTDTVQQLKTQGFKRLYSRQDTKRLYSGITVSGQGIYKTITGTPITGQTDLSYINGKNIPVTFIFAHAYKLNNTAESRWTLNDSDYETYRTNALKIAMDKATAEYADFRDTNDPCVLMAFPITVTIKADCHYTNIGAEDSVYLNDTLWGTSLGFTQSSNASVYGDIYNQALTALSGSYTYQTIRNAIIKKFQVQYIESTDSYSYYDPYCKHTITGLTNDDIDMLIGVRNINDVLELQNWYGYGFVVGTTKIVESGYDYEGASYSSNEKYQYKGWMSPNHIHNSALFVSDRFSIPNALTNTSITYSIKPIECNINIGSLGCAYTAEEETYRYWCTNDDTVYIPFVCNSTNYIEAVIKNNLSVYDIEYCGFVLNDYSFDMIESSKRRLNIPELYKDETSVDKLAGLTNANGKFVRVFAEREVLTSITNRKRSDGTAVTETNKIYDGFPLESDADDYQRCIVPSTVKTVSDHQVYDVQDLGWFYIKCDEGETITLDDLGYSVLLTSDTSTYDYVRPDSMGMLVFNETTHVYQSESGTSLEHLANGIYFLADGGAGLSQSESIIAPTYKKFDVNLSSSYEKKISEKVVANVVTEDKTKHISNYYFPKVECVTIDDTHYPLHREFADDSDYEFSPYDCSLDDFCGGYFYKKCCIKEEANGRAVLGEMQPYVVYKNRKLYLCGCDCTANYVSVVVNNIEYTASSSANVITIENSTVPIQYESMLYRRMSNYSSSETIKATDITYKFLKNLRLNSRALLKKKGTVEGLEAMLGLFGLKSKNWYDNLSLMQQDSWGNYDYTIKEYTCLTNKIEDLYDKRYNMGKIAYYNSLKSITHNNEDSSTNKYDGLPVTYVSYYKDKFGNVTDEQYTPDMSINVEYKKDLYPYFDSSKRYDGNTYYQMNGGWLPIYPFRYSVNNDVLLPYMNNNQIMRGLHTETLRNIRSFQNLEELLNVSQSSVKEDQIVEVQDLSKVYVVLNGSLFEVFTDSYIFENYDGIKQEHLCSYIKLFVSNNKVEAGEVFYRGDLYVSDPLSYCYDLDNNNNDFLRHYNLNDESDGKMIKVFLYKYDNIYRKLPVNVNKDELMSETELYVGIDLYDTFNSATFDIYKNSDGYSNYFKLQSPLYCDSLGGFGWYQLKKDDHDALRLDSIKDEYKGNNPHSDVYCKYDNGFEYFARFAELFRFPIENNSFSKNRFGYNGLGSYDDEEDNIASIGFDNIVSVSGNVENYSTTGESINTRDNYNMIEDRKSHFFGNFYTNNKDCVNVFKSNSKCINKYGLCDSVEMNDSNTQFYGVNPTYFQSGSVYSLNNISTTNSSVEVGYNDTYIRDNMGISADVRDFHTERIMNNKVLDINFVTDFEYYSKNYLEKYKYIDDVVLFYLAQMIPSTTICRINFGGSLKYMIKEGAIFNISSEGDVYLQEPDCGTVKFDNPDHLRIDKVSDLCPHTHPTTYFGVYFYADDTLVNQQKVSVGGRAHTPKEPTKEGYTFAGWDKDYSDIRRETVIHAKWKKD